MTFRFNSIRSRLIMFMLLVTTVPLLLSISFTYMHTRQTVKEQATLDNSQLIFQGSTNLINYLNSIDHASLSVYSSNDFIRNLSKLPEDYRAVAGIYTTLQNVYNSVEGIEQVYLHAHQSGQATLITATTPMRAATPEPYISTVRDQLEGEGAAVIQSTHRKHSYGFHGVPPSDKQVITFHRSIYPVPSKEQIAILAIDVNLSNISRISEQLYNKEKEQLLLIDSKGRVVYSGNEDEIGGTLTDTALTPQVFGEKRSGFFEKDGAMYVYQNLEASYADWAIVKIIPDATLYERNNQLMLINVGIAIAALALVIGGTILISIKITKPIQQLTNYMNVIQAGDLDVDITFNSPDETGIMFRRFRQMMDTINNLILREYRLELANKTNQLKALQAQINPHFLYNTLQSIGTVALQHNAPRVYKLLSSLSKMMRYSMKNDDRPVTLQDEIDHVTSYMELQMERFGDQMDFKLDLAPETLRFPLPKMILQPLVENYFKHGKDDLIQQGRSIISIASRMKESTLELVIENNGSSIPQEKLEHLQQQLLKQSEQELLNEMEDSIGIRNVLLRLKLHSGKASMMVDNIEPHGVRIIIEINPTESEST